MARPVSVRLSEERPREIDQLAERLKVGRSGALRRFIERGMKEACMDDAIDRLRKGKVSVGRAAELAGISLYEMLDLARRHHIAIRYGPGDLDRDLRDPRQR